MGEAKQVLVVRKDLKMRRGKEISQGGHGSSAWVYARLKERVGWWARLVCLFTGKNPTRFTPTERAWIDGPHAKVTLQTAGEESLRTLTEQAKSLGIEAHLITDLGRTEFHGVPTTTCLALGPDEPERIDAVTGQLELY